MTDTQSYQRTRDPPNPPGDVEAGTAPVNDDQNTDNSSQGTGEVQPLLRNSSTNDINMPHGSGKDVLQDQRAVPYDTTPEDSLEINNSDEMNIVDSDTNNESISVQQNDHSYTSGFPSEGAEALPAPSTLSPGGSNNNPRAGNLRAFGVVDRQVHLPQARVPPLQSRTNQQESSQPISGPMSMPSAPKLGFDSLLSSSDPSTGSLRLRLVTCHW